MKLPFPKYDSSEWIKAWYTQAAIVSMETGIFVDCRVEYASCANMNFSINRVYFVVDEHEFENLAELRKALENKAFL